MSKQHQGRIIPICGKEIYFPISLIPTRETLGDSKNPRWASYLDASGKSSLNRAETLEMLMSESSFKELQLGIEENQGTFDPVFAQRITKGQKSFDLIRDGVRRWGVYTLRQIAAKGKPGWWDHLPAYQIPNELSELDIVYLVGMMHSPGQREWEEYAKQSLYHSLHHKHNQSFEQIAKHYGKRAKTIEAGVKTVELSIKYRQQTKSTDNEYGKFAELLKIEGGKELVATQEKAVFKVMSQDKVPDAKLIRQLPAIFSNPHAKAALLKGKGVEAILDAMGILESEDPNATGIFRLMKQFQKQLKYHRLGAERRIKTSDPHRIVFRGLLSDLLKLAMDTNDKSFVKNLLK